LTVRLAMIVIAITTWIANAGAEPPPDAAIHRDAAVGSGGGVDAGVRGAGTADAGGLDAGVRSRLDAGVRGAGMRSGLDAGVRSGLDAGVRGAGDDTGVRSGLDAGMRGAGTADAGVVDAGVRSGLDAGVRGAGTADAGVVDAGVRSGLDAGVRSASVVDAGAVDAGVVDAGVVDAGVVDAGLGSADLIDAGVEVGDVETGVDAGTSHGQFASTEPPTATAQTTTESTLFAIKVIGGLIALLVLAYLGGHRRVVRFQERLGISGVITAGFPFIALGVVASLPSIGILTGDVLENMRPLLLFGLGWLGFIIGAQLDIRVLERVPRGTAYLILVESILPFAVTAAACGAVMIAFGTSWRDLSMWRDIVLLGAAAAMTAPRRFRGFANRSWREGRSADVLLAQLDELVGVIGLLFITAYFRVSETAWQLPDTAWIFVSLGIGVAVGALIFAMVRMPRSNAEFLAVVLGGIAFASGFAGYLRLSPIVICFIAGVLVTNFPNDVREDVFRILRHLERPVHLLFLIIAGAVWSVSDWRGWVLVPVFVIARVIGKWLGIFASRSRLDESLTSGRTLITPMSVLSIALVISAEHTYAGTRTLPWVVTAVIGGALLSEMLQATPARDDDVPVAAPAHVDELDDDSGPVYLVELDGGNR